MAPSRPQIPPDRDGYMIVGAVVHTRYASHCPRGIRLRSTDEAFAAVGRLDYSVCAECYPAIVTKPTPRRRTTTRRRTPRRQLVEGS